MSKYTTQLRWIVEQVQGKVPYSASQRYTPETWEKIGLADYDLWEPDYRATLNAKIIDHYYFKEIGFETVAQFAWYIRMTMQEIMPYYNKLYETQAMMTEPLRDWYRHGTRDNQNIVSGSIENEMLYGGSDRSAYGAIRAKHKKNANILRIRNLHRSDTAIIADEAKNVKILRIDFLRPG